LAKSKHYQPEKVIFNIIFTTNIKSDEDEQKDNYNEIKKCFMGEKQKGKALMIQLNED